MPQTTVYRPTPTNPSAPVEPKSASAAVEDTNELLDEIDSVLEEHALEVVRTYVNRGGQ